MFCTKCGAKIADGSAFCTACGNPVGAAPARPANPMPPQPQPIVVGPIMPSMPDSEMTPSTEKKTLFNSFGTGKRMLSRIMALVCVALLLLSYVVTMNTSLEKIPMVSMAIGGAADEFDEMKDELADVADEMDRTFEKQEDELSELLSKSEMKDLEKFIDVFSKCAKSFSLNNVSSLLKYYEKFADSDVIREIPYITNSMDDVREIESIISIVKVILLGFALVCCLFLFFGGFAYKPGLAIFGTILSVLYCVSFCGFLFIALNLVAQVCMIVIARQAKRE